MHNAITIEVYSTYVTYLCRLPKQQSRASSIIRVDRVITHKRTFWLPCYIFVANGLGRWEKNNISLSLLKLFSSRLFCSAHAQNNKKTFPPSSISEYHETEKERKKSNKVRIYMCDEMYTFFSLTTRYCRVYDPVFVTISK